MKTQRCSWFNVMLAVVMILGVELIPKDNVLSFIDALYSV